MCRTPKDPGGPRSHFSFPWKILILSLCPRCPPKVDGATEILGIGQAFRTVRSFCSFSAAAWRVSSFFAKQKRAMRGARAGSA